MNVTIAAAQYPIYEHHSFANYKHYVAEWVEKAVAHGADVLLFPEYGSMELVSLFPDHVRQDIRRQVIELDAMKDAFCSVYADLACEYKKVIVAPSLPVIDSGRQVNRAYVFSESGLKGFQDKFFMTRFEDEEWGIESGEKVLSLFEADWGSFGIQICYDVEFPLGSQRLCSAGASVILAPSCTETIRGATRVHVGARARSLENQAYSIVSQTIGEAQWSPAVDYNYGFAAVYTTPDKLLPEEGIVSQKTPQIEGWLVQTLDMDALQNVRNDGQVFNFKDTQRLTSGLDGQSISVNRIRI